MSLKLENLEEGMQLYKRCKVDGRYETVECTFSRESGSPLLYSSHRLPEVLLDEDLEVTVYADKYSCDLNCAGLNGDCEEFERLMLEQGIDLTDPDVLQQFIAQTMADAMGVLGQN